jgi:putative membrane protein
LIVRNRPSGWRLFFLLRGSIVPKIAPQILATMLVALVVAYFHGVFFARDLTFTATPFTIIGLALSIFLGFRNGAAYDRFWEGRRLWGDLVIASRTLARQAMTDPTPDLAPLLEPEELLRALASVNPPQALLRSLGRDLGEALSSGALVPPLAIPIDATLDSMERILAGCERLKSTPIPFSYMLLLHRTAYLYCFLLPFGLVDTVGMATPIVVGLVSYTFFGLDTLGDEIEEPFGTQPNDLPLAAISRTIEINLREALGEPDLPAPLAPVDYCLM